MSKKEMEKAKMIELSGNLRDACYHNCINHDDILEELYEITGENDGASWHWIVRTEKGYAYIEGGCDYTGWDCHSHAYRYDAIDLMMTLNLVPIDIKRLFIDMILAKRK